MSEKTNSFVRLNNEQSTSNSFRTTRNVGDGNSRESSSKIVSQDTKSSFQTQLRTFIQATETRKESKTIINPENQIDYIHFTMYGQYTRDLQSKFFGKYGLDVIRLYDFNNKVILKVTDPNRFATFIDHFNELINSPANSSYAGKDYNILVNIEEFHLYSSTERIHKPTDDVLFHIDSDADGNQPIQQETLIAYLTDAELPYTLSDGATSLAVKGINGDLLNEIIDNFDIVISVTSSKSLRVRSSVAGPVKDYGFTVTIPDDLPTVGVIDSGLQSIDPLAALIEDGIDLTSTAYAWDEMQHGTAIAGIIAFGDQFYINPDQPSYSAKAKLIGIKALHNENDPLDIQAILDAIHACILGYGTKLFNLSLNLDRFKKYNERHSLFAYELDKLAFEEDVLIFISAGNFAEDSLLDILDEEDLFGDHDYPFFFDNADSQSLVHVCEDTNLFAPAESMNNITVGALAGNLDLTADNSDKTPLNLYPSYYTRKYHYDKVRSKESLGVTIKIKQLNKPDFVFDGGDYANDDSAFDVLSTDRQRGYYKTSGTSLSTPFITSYAAEILRAYPTLKAQTIKALLINSASYKTLEKLPEFSNNKDDKYLLKRLCGFGTPIKSDLIKTSNNSITYIIEDEIKLQEMKKIPILLPPRLQNSGNKLQFDISLAFAFDPIENNQSEYLPFHMSFGLFHNLPMYELSQGVVQRQKDTAADTPIIGIKKGSISWSEDWLGTDKWLPSNAHKRTDRLQPDDFAKVNNEVALALRCYANADFRKENKNLSNPFSIVIRITELCENENQSKLYAEMINLNNYIAIEPLIDLDVDA
jgi:hypothetical protein